MSYWKAVHEFSIIKETAANKIKIIHTVHQNVIKRAPGLFQKLGLLRPYFSHSTSKIFRYFNSKSDVTTALHREIDNMRPGQFVSRCAHSTAVKASDFHGIAVQLLRKLRTNTQDALQTGTYRHL